MEILILAAVIFFFGIGLVFEILGFLFRILFAGFGGLLGLILAAVVALVTVPIILGVLGFLLPPFLILLGALVLVGLVTGRSRRLYRDRRRDYRYYN